jgi:hypothetical protein
MSNLREEPQTQNWDIEMSVHDHDRYNDLMQEVAYGRCHIAGSELVEIRDRLLEGEYFKQLAVLNIMERKYDLDIPWLGTGRGV